MHVALLGGLSYRNHRSKDRRSEAPFTITNTTNGLYLNFGAQVFLGQ